MAKSNMRRVLKNIRYKGPKNYRALVLAGSEEAEAGMDFSHLEDHELELLEVTGVLGPVVQKPDTTKDKSDTAKDKSGGKS